MGCMMEFAGEQFQLEANKQKIMIGMLLQYGELDTNQLALSLGVSIDNIQDICDDKDFLADQQAENLSQIFLRFLGRSFFQKFSIIRNFVNQRF